MKYGKDSSIDFTKKILDAIKEKEKNFDMILLNGDLVRHKIA